MSVPPRKTIFKFVTHSKKVISIASESGWLPGARYTNLRDIKTFDRVGFLDIDWKNYNFSKHLEAAKQTKPIFTVARDIERRSDLKRILDQAYALSEHASKIIIVPKCQAIAGKMDEIFPEQFIFGYSVPTRYGGTQIPITFFRREVHLLGGRPEIQRTLANQMHVVSIDCNRFTLDAAFGDFFDGEIFRPHLKGGYDVCLRDSIKNINQLWNGYMVKTNCRFLNAHLPNLVNHKKKKQ